jgi:hypothetical protein
VRRHPRIGRFRVRPLDFGPIDRKGRLACLESGRSCPMMRFPSIRLRDARIPSHRKCMEQVVNRLFVIVESPRFRHGVIVLGVASERNALAGIWTKTAGHRVGVAQIGVVRKTTKGEAFVPSFDLRRMIELA